MFAGLGVASSSIRVAFAAFVVLGVAAGCQTGGTGGRVATDVDPVTATPEYWWDKPSPVKIPAPEFDRAFLACQGVLRDYFFVVDRADARSGVLTTTPMTTAQWFEPWRPDNTTSGDVARSSLATYRRTARFDIARNADGSFTITPRVLVERQSLAGRRVSGVLGFRTFTSIDQTSLTALTTEGQAPPLYWYPVARDYDLELELGEKVVKKMY